MIRTLVRTLVRALFALAVIALVIVATSAMNSGAAGAEVLSVAAIAVSWFVAIALLRRRTLSR